jgi:pimeloyl-ACP methyl ester carboxylesterase
VDDRPDVLVSVYFAARYGNWSPFVVSKRNLPVGLLLLVFHRMLQTPARKYPRSPAPRPRDPVTLVYQRSGSGPPLVLIHGTGGYWRTWLPVIDRLAERREVFAIDLPGFGGSAPLPRERPATIANLADAVARWADDTGLERPHVAGNSLGGAVALELARTGRACSATAISPIGFSTPAEFAYAAFSLRAMHRMARLSRPVAPVLFRSRVGRTLALWQAAGRPWRMSAGEALSGARAMTSAPGFHDQVRAVKGYEDAGPPPVEVPITIAWGTRDRLLAQRQAARARQAMPDARFVPLLGCGHVPFWDDPDLVAEVLLSGSSRGLAVVSEQAAGGR